VVRQTLTLAVVGTAVGAIGAIAVTRLLASLLYASSPTDVFTFAAVACMIPAREVTGIDPAIALPSE